MKSATVLVLIALCNAALADAAPIYQIATLGLHDLEHTRSDGYESSTAEQLNQVGQVVGYSERYNGSAANVGQSVWYYNGASTSKIGFVDAEHTRNDGYKSSSIAQSNVVPATPLFNDEGFVAGYSDRYSPTGSDFGQSAWLFDGSTTVRVGLTDAEHTSSGGSKESTIAAKHTSHVVLPEFDLSPRRADSKHPPCGFCLEEILVVITSHPECHHQQA
jgi:hypothetical protein